MNHNTNAISSLATCDNLLNNTTEDKARFVLKINTFANRIATGTTAAGELSNDFSAAQTELAQLTALVPTMPDGPLRNEMLDDINDLKNDVITFGRRMNNSGPLALYMMDVDRELISAKVGAANEFIQQVQDRRNALATP